MSTVTQLLCNKFGGIRERNASFSAELITAQDLQNIELYYTGTNSGIGIRTVKGNTSINDQLVGKANIIKLFETTQKNSPRNTFSCSGQQKTAGLHVLSVHRCFFL